MQRAPALSAAGHLVFSLAALILASEAAAVEAFVEQKYPTRSRPRSVAATDLDGDGLADLVAANHDSHNVSVLLNHGGLAAIPVLTPPGLALLALGLAALGLRRRQQAL